MLIFVHRRSIILKGALPMYPMYSLFSASKNISSTACNWSVCMLSFIPRNFLYSITCLVCFSLPCFYQRMRFLPRWFHCIPQGPQLSFIPLHHCQLLFHIYSFLTQLLRIHICVLSKTCLCAKHCEIH